MHEPYFRGSHRAPLETTLTDTIMTSVSAEPHHSFRSLLAGLPAGVELPAADVQERCFKIRAAESHRERRSAGSLVERMYATRGYQGASLPEEESAHRKTFLASNHDIALGTLTIGVDSSDGLLVDALFADHADRFRDDGLRICEFTKLAMDRRARSPRLLASLFHVAYIYAHRVKALDNLLIEVNPRHVRYYESMLGFKVIGAERHNSRVNAPAVLLSLDLSHAEEQIRIFGGKPEMAASERSAYPYFFSVHDETGIVGRLMQANEDIAHVRESESRRSVTPRPSAPMH